MRHAIHSLPGLLLKDIGAARKPPILVAGLPRSGSSWLAKVLSTAQSLKHYREPFNRTWQHWAEPFHLQYIPEGERFEDFDTWCREAFNGGVVGPYVNKHHWGRHRRFAWWPGRVLVKEVHAVLTLKRIAELVEPRIVVIVRHPCALAASWSRMRELRPDDPHWRRTDAHLARLLEQPALLRDWLEPYATSIQQASTYYEQIGALWGATYSVMVGQARRRGWTIVTHEALSANPRAEFEALFSELHLTWTDSTSEELADSISTPSEKPFETKRVSSEEVDKWKDDLSGEEAEAVCSFAKPFALDIYEL